MKNKPKQPNRRPMNMDGHWKTNFDYAFLGSHDLPELAPDGKDLILTIKEFYQEEVTNTAKKTEWCNVVAFHEKKINGFDVKPMIVNKTNFKILQDIFKSERASAFINKRIYLYGKTGVRSFQGTVTALRFREFLPPDKLPAIRDSELTKAAEYLNTHGNLDGFHAVRSISKENVKKIEELAKNLKNDAK